MTSFGNNSPASFGPPPSTKAGPAPKSWPSIPPCATSGAACRSSSPAPPATGKVLFLGTDSAWRWRRGVEDKFHYRFWGQVVRWMAHQRHLSDKDGIRLAYSPETPVAGDTVFLQSTVLDQSGFPIDKGPVTGKMTGPSGRTERLEFAQVEGGWGVFKSAFAAQEKGKYKIEVASEPYGRHLTTDLLVASPLIEKQGQPVNAQTLNEIAALTRGAVSQRPISTSWCGRFRFCPSRNRRRSASVSGANPPGAGFSWPAHRLLGGPQMGGPGLSLRIMQPVKLSPAPDRHRR